MSNLPQKVLETLDSMRPESFNFEHLLNENLQGYLAHRSVQDEDFAMRLTESITSSLPNSVDSEEEYLQVVNAVSLATLACWYWGQARIMRQVLGYAMMNDLPSSRLVGKVMGDPMSKVSDAQGEEAALEYISGDSFRNDVRSLLDKYALTISDSDNLTVDWDSLDWGGTQTP